MNEFEVMLITEDLRKKGVTILCTPVTSVSGSITDWLTVIIFSKMEK